MWLPSDSGLAVRAVLSSIAGSLFVVVATAQQFSMEQELAGSSIDVIDVVSADLDGDGDQDALVAGHDDDLLVWYENTDGMGSFGPLRLITAQADGAYAVRAVDLDGDGDLDVVTTTQENPKVRWYENLDGAGSYGPRRAIAARTYPPTMLLSADLDGDGDMDVVAAHGFDFPLEWFENADGLGNFGPPRLLTDQAALATSISAEDFDGDGDQDILVACSIPDELDWLENIDGQGTFGPPRLIAPGTEYCHTACGADVDGDGDTDVIAGSNSSTSVGWYENGDGQGSFGPRQVISAQVGNVAQVSASDIDGDGDQDVLARNLFVTVGEAFWFENLDGAGTYGPLIPIPVQGVGVWIAQTSDLDGNSSPDLLYGSGRDDRVAWLENTDGEGTFGNEHVITTVQADGPHAIFAADMDEDGDLDAVSASQLDKRVSWYENTDGLGSFGPSQVITAEYSRPMSVFPADLDGDGDLDVLAGAYDSYQLWWCENYDLGIYGPPQTIDVLWPFGFTAVRGADLDGDGDPDVIAASTCVPQGSRISWYENTDGQGAFGPPQVFMARAHGIQDLRAVDLDGDGDQDVLTSHIARGEIAWNENTDGAGTFGAAQLVTDQASDVRSVEAADLDGDGDPDVLSASGGEGIAWYENVEGAFGTARIITQEVVTPRFVLAADVDGDGDLDVLSASSDDDKVAWYQNLDGRGSFGAQMTIEGAAEGARAVVAADLDGDGDWDVLVASYDDDTIAWYRNNGIATSASRNAGTNPESYTPSTQPELGATYTGTVDLGGTSGHPFALLQGYLSPLTFTLGSGQTLLVNVADPNGEMLAQSVRPGPTAVFSVSIPLDPALVGVHLHTQAVHLGGPQSFVLSNAQDLILGY